ncbi:Intraflagellar transport protein 57 like [Dissostichus eleginoides]|uniref:Intraflagellar transport protein 57 homolog n=1 Tax=Dissostichus eleginoides TaxID=100907 RepID=A0AAD9BBF3_DISEL|nr:Intraflagellar transport protein 57 like [Dissostichus eleginoides]
MKMADEGRRGEEDGGPGAVHQVFVVMESLLEKLKVLNYEEEILAKHNMKNLSRHYFVSSPFLAVNPGEQFFLFTVIAAWLINEAGRPFTAPQEHDEPNATVSNILSELRAFGVKVDFPPSKLKSGQESSPNYPAETTEEESVIEDDAELTLSKVEEEMIEEPDDEEENVMDLEALKLRTCPTDTEASSKPEEILEATVDAAEWSLEVERVLPQLKVTVRTDNKSYLDRLQEDVGKTLEKAKERYQQASGGVTERTRVLAEISEELEKVKQEMEEKGSSMSDGAPVVKIKQSLTKLKQEIIQMDVRIGVVEHTLLQAKLKEKSNMTRDMNATNLPEPATGPFA